MAETPVVKHVSVGIIGDFNPNLPYHRLTQEAICHAADALNVRARVDWIPTPSLTDQAVSGRLEPFDALWSAPGDYQSMNGALAGICFARRKKVPFLGTCGGFQHALLEFARNVMGMADAAHEEITPHAPTLFITRLACSLAGKTQIVRILPGSRTREAYGCAEAEEQFVCNFGVNPRFRESIQGPDLRVTGVDVHNDIRVIELKDHPFFLATLYQPQISSGPGNPHPLIKAFLAAACQCGGQL